MDRLRKDIVPGEGDDNLRRFISDLGKGGTRIWRTRSQSAQASSSPPNSLSTASPKLATSPTPSTKKAKRQDKKILVADSTATSTHSGVVESVVADLAVALKALGEIGGIISKTQKTQADFALHPSFSSTMSTQRSRLGRSNARGGSQDINAQAIWNDFYRDHLTPVKELETRARQIGEKIIELEAKMQRNKVAGHDDDIVDIDALSSLYREQIKVSEDLGAKIKDEGMTTMLQMMIDMKKQEEQAAAEKSRNSSSRPVGLDFDGPSDSPVPSPADNRQIKKLGTSRTGSQPPSRPEGTPSEASERASKPKIVYAQHEEVAFKRKLPNKPDEQDWILGKVSRVIGEGKSRRYEVQDPFPDTDINSSGPVYYKSSASQMVPIPPEGSPLEDYEVGKRVLALYPDTTTFYRAEVKAMLNGGTDVQLLFEDEAAGELKVVTRRLVLDHKG